LFVPGVRQGLHVPHHLPPFLLGATVIAATLVAWAAIAPGHISNESQYIPARSVPSASIHSIAYTVFEGTQDKLLVRRANADTTTGARQVTSFPVFGGLHAQGAASPMGDRIAVLWGAGQGSVYVRMALVSVSDDNPAGRRVEVPVDFDYLSTLSWSPDGARLAATRSTSGTDANHGHADVIEVDAATARIAVVASFDNVFSVKPVGYSLDGERLFIVAIDQTGTTLWTERGGKLQKGPALSTGNTTDWSLSPDGSRLAFVEIQGAGIGAHGQRYAGKTLLIATGAISEISDTGNQRGPAWEPGSQIPVFGGPNGSVQLEAGAADGSFVIPAGWSPDGSTLVAKIYTAASDPSDSPTESIWLITGEHRVALEDSLEAPDGARFLGWVLD
jgi:WD40-like Beta Propeller Repeat